MRQAVLVLLLAGCASTPKYDPPKPDLPVAWKVEAPFRESTPGDSLAKGKWWERFGDAKLNDLAEQAIGRSPTLAVAALRLAQARASLGVANSAAYPQVGLFTRYNRTRITQNRPLTNNAAPNFSTTQNDFTFGLTASYEVDVGARVSSLIAGATASLEQSGADFENVRLLLIADLATAYFNLRQTDVELGVLASAIELQKRSLELARTRHQLGAGTGLDVAQQQALIDTTLTQVDLLRRQRAQFEHAIATLVAVPAPIFSLPEDAKPMTPPSLPIGVPSDLLERRPDVASAERAMAAANAQIGVANAAFYPSVILGASGGQESRIFDTLLHSPSHVWSLGVSLLQPIFDAGRAQSGVDFARAGYETATQNYRRVILNAMQEAEDGIIGLAALERAYRQAQVAVDSAQRTVELVNARFEGGIAGPLEVITVQQSLLNSERLVSQLAGQQLLTSVFLVKALGGDWQGLEPRPRERGSASR